MRRETLHTLLIIGVSLWTGIAASASTVERPSPLRWEEAIGEFAKADQAALPPKEGIVFVGSSSIRLWKLNTSFPDLPVINRGFGGSHLGDSLHYCDRLVLKYAPRTVVVYAGDNDVAHGLRADEVIDDYRGFVDRVHKALPKTKIVYIAIKPSIARRRLWPEMIQANQGIRQIASRHERLEFIDIAKPMLNDQGAPRPELFVADGLHLNQKGYELWTSLVLPHLKRQPSAPTPKPQ